MIFQSCHKISCRDASISVLIKKKKWKHPSLYILSIVSVNFVPFFTSLFINVIFVCYFLVLSYCWIGDGEKFLHKFLNNDEISRLFTFSPIAQVHRRTHKRSVLFSVIYFFSFKNNLHLCSVRILPLMHFYHFFHVLYCSSLIHKILPTYSMTKKKHLQRRLPTPVQKFINPLSNLIRKNLPFLPNFIPCFIHCQC